MPAAVLPLDRFYSVIPAGGVGSRLWPLSRADAPKFLHDLTGSGQTLLKDTWDRLAPLSGDQRIMVVTGRAHRAAVETQLPGLADDNVVLESEPRDSTAAIGLAAAILERREPGVVIGSFAADHVISGDALFRAAVADAVAAARCRVHRDDRHHADRARRGLRVHRVRRRRSTVDGAERVEAVSNFVEKPDLETAKRLPRGRRRTSGTRACSSRGVDRCSTRSRATSPSCTPASSSSPRPGTTPRPADRRSTASGRRSRRSPSTTPSPSRPPRRGASP